MPTLQLSSYSYIDFIKAVDNFDWISNIVPVPKKDGRVRVCIDFKNRKKHVPKAFFPLSHIDVLVDKTIVIVKVYLLDFSFTSTTIWRRFEILVLPEVKLVL